MFKLKSVWNNTHLRNILRYFVFLFILPFILITGLILNNLSDSFSQQAMQEQLLRTEQAMDTLSNWLVSFDQILAQLVGDNELNRDKLHLYSEQNALQHRLRLMTAAHNGLKNIWYQLPEEAGFLSGGDSISIERLNDHRYYTEGISDSESTIYNQLLEGTILSVYDRYGVQHCLLYPVFINTRGITERTMIIFELSLDTITQELENLYGSYPGQVRLRTADGRTLTESSNHYQAPYAEPLPCTQSMTQSYAKWMDYHGGLFQSNATILTSVSSSQWAIDLICVNNLMSNFQTMQSVTFMLMAVFILGCCICLVLTIRLYKPIRSLRNSLSNVADISDINETDDYDYIESSIELINSDNRQLRKLLHDHTQKTQDFVASMLFSGRIHSRDDLVKTYSFCDRLPDDDQYWILAADTVSRSLDDLLSCIQNHVFYQVTAQRCVFFCPGQLSPLLPVGVGASGPSGKWEDIPLHCAKAWFACTTSQSCYSPEVCKQTILKAGDAFTAAFHRAINEQEISALRTFAMQIPASELYLQTCALAAAILQWLETLDSVLLDDASIFYVSPDASTSELRNIFDTLLSLMELLLKPEEREGGDTLEQMHQYIAKHYDTPDFSIKQMASDFSMSISALSSYFKNHTGLLLSDYITEMKMKKAMHLLEFSNLSIQEVGLSIGYLNVTSFIRRFQQVNQMSPKEYRSKQLAKKKP